MNGNRHAAPRAPLPSEKMDETAEMRAARRNVTVQACMTND
jgi:hypothetical protein